MRLISFPSDFVFLKNILDYVENVFIGLSNKPNKRNA